MSALDDLYQDAILDHSQHPRNFGPLPGADRSASADNPFCGDRVTVALALAGERVADARFEGAGCAIAMASASMLTEAIKTRTRAEIETLARAFEAFLAGAAPDPAALGELAAFAAVARYPVRAKCARLAWQALAAALEPD
jgi:nitrogen fixation NifU-like protein